MFHISYRNCALLAASKPEKGSHHYSFKARMHFEEVLEMIQSANIATDGLFLNADASFDSKEFWPLCYHYSIILNFCFNKRNGKANEREEYFDPESYKQPNGG